MILLFLLVKNDGTLAVSCGLIWFCSCSIGLTPYLVPITSSPLILRWVTNIVLIHFCVFLFHIYVSLTVDGIVSHVLKVHINDIILLVLIPSVNIIPSAINKYCYFLFGCCCIACGFLVPWLGFKPVPSALKVQSLNHWTTGKVPC